ncbi:unnamed protein product [Sphenostylis stenocarpa]|uniref:Uncharacterized protein n=1 Tax=Sphenostylis stenocarpa TaxID=92480 RepID=A0AA86RYH2_9FABA|nr:unnamed protein product [Sphenostylis stenocarpa]
MSTEHAELSLEAPIYEAFLAISPKSVLSFISTALSVVLVFFLLLVFAAYLLTVSLTTSSNGPWKTMEKLNSKGKGRESDVNHRKKNNFLSARYSRSGKETSQPNNPNQHDNYKADHSFDSSPNNPCVTDSSTGHGYGIRNCFNNNGDGEQNYSYCRINSLASINSYNNNALGLQDLSHAKIYASRTESAFNNSSSCSQTFRRATIDNRDDSNELNARDNSAAIRDIFTNNGKNGIQNFDDFHIFRGKVMDEHQSGN